MAGRTVAGGRYELETLPVATGGMGEVYFGRDVKLDREIAVKFVRFPDGGPDDELVHLACPPSTTPEPNPAGRTWCCGASEGRASRT